MKDIGEGTIRRIDWQELTPIVVLLRIFNTATGLRVMFLSAVGMLLTLASGYLLNAILLQRTIEAAPKAEGTEIVEIETIAIPKPGGLFTSPAYIEPLLGGQELAAQALGNEPPFRKSPGTWLWECAQRSVFVPWDLFSTAGVRFFAAEPLGLSQRGLAFGWLLILAVIWALFGGLICRTVALRLTVDESESPAEIRQFMAKWGNGFLSGPFLVLLGVICCLIPLKLAGLLYAVPVLGTFVALLFPVVLLFALFAIMLLLGLLVGWPLLFASVAVDGADGFEAVSRTYSYVYQRPLHYLLYWIVSGVLGILGFIIISIFVDAVLALSVKVGGFPLSEGYSSFGAFLLREGGESRSMSDAIVLAWCGLAQLMKPAFVFGWFWTSSVTIYLLLRRSVDATPLLEVLRVGAAAEKAEPLPPIIPDEKGAPEIKKADGDRPQT